jgi:hypothetical protein
VQHNTQGAVRQPKQHQSTALVARMKLFITAESSVGRVVMLTI